MREIEGGATAAKGFLAASAAAGIKYEGRDDMAMLYSESPCEVAGTFTSNAVKAAPVLWDQKIARGAGVARAVVVNSGIANACTGAEGMECCRVAAERTASALGIESGEVLVASTGVIGRQLPMDRVCAGIDAMAKGLSKGVWAGRAAACAIMTTDTHPKEAAAEFEIGGRTVTVGGMCKGSGMIHPNMCTMLSFVTTDAAIDGRLLQEALSNDVVDTYNMVSVDGDTSTNDTCLLLANGAAGNDKILEKNEDYMAFCEALRFVNESLARQMAGDGEGATALLEVRVVHAATKEDARLLSRSVASSTLTKAAICGHDANWGRILCALGYSGARLDPERVDVYFESAAGKILVARDGMAADYSEEEATKILSEPEVTVIADVKMGEEGATAWGCDLTHEYVSINADYRS